MRSTVQQPCSISSGRPTPLPEYSPRRAFTLIELLTVISILAMLAAILFPVFARARENARRASCQSNLKQIGLATLQYAQDYDERMVKVYTYYGPGSTNLVWWQDVLQPYMKSYQIVLCASQSPPSSYALNRPVGFPDPLLTSYAGNNVLKDASGNALFPPLRSGPNPGRAMSALEEPATTILFLETVTDNMEFFAWSQTDLGNSSVVDKRHFQGCNFAFADGHAKWLQATKPEMWTIQAD
jgi:prepilin-type N-terminal cleavage/methylation domain-containing protein/prepilin-type processing-associated H-X9-DG protein